MAGYTGRITRRMDLSRPGYWAEIDPVLDQGAFDHCNKLISAGKSEEIVGYQLSRVIVAWNLDDEFGRPLEVRLENMHYVKVPDQRRILSIVQKVSDALAEVPDEQAFLSTWITGSAADSTDRPVALASWKPDGFSGNTSD